jgi:hypothetical protein
VTISDDTITGDDAANMTSGTTILARDRFTADYEGVGCGANCAVQDSVIAMRPNSVEGFDAYCQPSASTGTSLVNDTIIGAAGDSAFANCADPGQSATVNASSTVLRGAAQYVFRAAASSGGTVSITPTYNDFDPATEHTSGAGASIAADPNHINADPLFINAAAGDYRIPYNSPLVDAGSSDPIGFLESATDLAGNPRIVNTRRDIGAYEYQRLKPSAVIHPSATTAVTGQSVTFDGSHSTDGDPGDTLTYSWSFDDGTTARGTTITHAFATAGPHTATLTVTDPTNLSDTATAHVTVSSSSGGSTGPGGQATLTHLTQSAPSWSEGPTLAVFARGGAARRPPVGTTFGFALNVPATVRGVFTRLLPGRAVGGKCIATTRRNRRARVCTRLLAVGLITHAAHAGANTVRFDGTLTARTRLPLGRYKATFTAARPGAKASAPLSVTFTIVGPQPHARSRR